MPYREHLANQVVRDLYSLVEQVYDQFHEDMGWKVGTEEVKVREIRALVRRVTQGDDAAMLNLTRLAMAQDQDSYPSLIGEIDTVLQEVEG